MIQPGDERTWYRWGTVLLEHAKAKIKDKKGNITKKWLPIKKAAGNLLEISCSKFKEAVKIKATEYDIVYNYGIALLWLARLKIDSKVDSLQSISILDQACFYFEQASLIK